MTGSDPVTRDDLHAYVDGRLDPEDQARVEAWLAEHPDDSAEVHAYRLQNRQLHDSFDAVLDEPVAPELAAIAARSAGGSAGPPPPSRGLAPWMRIAASIVLLAAGGIGGWLSHGWYGGAGASGFEAFAEGAVGAHRVFVAEVRHPVEVQSAQEAHLVAWLSKRLGTKLVAPQIVDSGFQLVGGRLLAEGARPAAQFMYEDSGGRRLTIYIRATEKVEDTSFRFASDNGVSAFYWVESDFAYALIAPIDRPALLDIANKVYRDLEQ